MHKRRSLFLAFFVFFIDNFGYGLVFPLFATLLLHASYGILSDALSLHTKNLLLGFLIGAYPFAQFFGAPLFGDLADRKGRKKGFYATLIGVAIGYLFTGVALAMKSYIALFLGRLITGFFAGNWSISFATIADLSEDEKKRAKNFSWIATVGGVSWVLSMIVGGDFSDPNILKYFTPAFPFWFASFLCLLTFLAVYFWFEETLTSDHRPTETMPLLKGAQNLSLAIKHKGARAYFAILFFYMTAWSMVLTWVAATTIEKFHGGQIDVTSILIGVGIIWGISSSLLNPFLIKRLSLNLLVTIAIGLLAIIFFGTFFSVKFWHFVVFYLVASAVAPLVWSNILNLISISAPQEIQGLTMGIGQSVMSFGQMIAPILGGFIALYFIKAIYLGSSLLSLSGFLLLLFLQKRQSRF